MKQKTLFTPFLVFIATALHFLTGTAFGAEFSYESGGKVYRYSVVESGDNYNYEFESNPGNTLEQLKAGVHVLQSIYKDPSINLENREPYIRERATCSLFEGGLYNYTFCIFPNDFSPRKEELFRGFVTQLPNWKWMVIWNLLPVLLVFGMIFFFTKKQKKQ
jgi:hypothetical protein